MHEWRMFEQTADLPELFTRWFERRGWKPRPHQLAVLAKVQAGLSVLLIAPTKPWRVFCRASSILPHQAPAAASTLCMSRL
jgi:hypothetical protein